MNIIVDTNLWVSFLIGKRLKELKKLLNDKNLHIFVCNQLLDELKDVTSRKKIQKYVGITDIIDTFDLINNFCQYVVIQQNAQSSVRDINDLYLLSLADTVKAEYLITGDKDLLTLHSHNQTKIVSFTEFTTR
ncbi:MAG: putative toxin-antitoxin system toxin component, PIN family [Paludibacter sp.]|jgi:putative PIN family toxin of toxin-antitoxin system|nr:putative toxin-antitoxin system toxin component, PIN family [Paludibacter sp.]